MHGIILMLPICFTFLVMSQAISLLLLKCLSSCIDLSFGTPHITYLFHSYILNKRRFSISCECLAFIITARKQSLCEDNRFHTTSVFRFCGTSRNDLTNTLRYTARGGGADNSHRRGKTGKGEKIRRSCLDKPRNTPPPVVKENNFQGHLWTDPAPTSSAMEIWESTVFSVNSVRLYVGKYCHYLLLYFGFRVNYCLDFLNLFVYPQFEKLRCT